MLERIKDSGSIFFAESDRNWILDGANVHISMVGFGDDNNGTPCILDGRIVREINANLTADADVTTAAALANNAALSFIGVSLHGPFELEEVEAIEMLQAGGNPTGRPNSDVVRPILNADGIVKTRETRWVVAFPCEMSCDQACLYEVPMESVRKTVLPVRQQNHRKTYRERWWIHGEARPAMQCKINALRRFVLTPRVGKHRIFVWAVLPIYPSDATVVFVRDDDSTFGILQSHAHAVWALRLGTRLETRPRYTPTTSFETFPFPQPTTEQEVAISAAAKELDDLRCRWLNPPEWTKTETLEFPGSIDGPWGRYVVEPDTHGVGTVRWPARRAQGRRLRCELEEANPHESLQPAPCLARPCP